MGIKPPTTFITVTPGFHGSFTLHVHLWPFVSQMHHFLALGWIYRGFIIISKLNTTIWLLWEVFPEPKPWINHLLAPCPFLWNSFQYVTILIEYFMRLSIHILFLIQLWVSWEEIGFCLPLPLGHLTRASSVGEHHLQSPVRAWRGILSELLLCYPSLKTLSIRARGSILSFCMTTCKLCGLFCN